MNDTLDYTYHVPIDLWHEILGKSHIPGSEEKITSRLKVVATTFRNLDLVLSSACFGLGALAEYYVLGDLRDWKHQTYEDWYDDEAIRRGERSRGDKRGTLVTARGEVRVITGTAGLIAGLPSIEAATSQAEIQTYIDRGQGLGYWYHQEIKRGALALLKQVGSFVIMSMTFDEEISKYIWWRENYSLTCTRLDSSYRAEIESLLPRGDRQGQLSLF